MTSFFHGHVNFSFGCVISYVGFMLCVVSAVLDHSPYGSVRFNIVWINFNLIIIIQLHLILIESKHIQKCNQHSDKVTRLVHMNITI